ncbi:MerR family transcriptional regulator [Paenibacillus sp. J22TS3]|uniref:MerR family transcriptional regulator n=1 Tax=Paenibacillus sp. J22TS3 TaxID=2807192 RepID=UPI001B19C702|nr:MerR family transcriptional regulator [Paenibacillus sp. J22TS3]GIP21315.1 HTH-type transcriptional regulator YfmP [Paenibacillus sp. J22TS3]
MHVFKIEEVAKETGLTKRTIRYYEELGLLPTPKRSEGGMRLYTQEDIVLLQKIISAKEVLGFSLQELHKYITMAELLKDKNQRFMGEQESLSGSQRREMLVEIHDMLEEQLGLLSRKMDNIIKFRSDLIELQQRVGLMLGEIQDTSAEQEHNS